MRRQLLKEFLFEKKLLVNIKNTLFSSKVLENFEQLKPTIMRKKDC